MPLSTLLLYTKEADLSVYVFEVAIIDFAGTKGTVRNIEVFVLRRGLPVIGYQNLLGYSDKCWGWGGWDTYITSVLWSR